MNEPRGITMNLLALKTYYHSKSQHPTNKRFLYIKLFFLFILFHFAQMNQAQNISFKNLDLDDGLSEVAGLAIEQDYMNRMWFGTRSGLNCWDGVRMKTFYPQRGDTTSLMEHKISDLKITGKYLWARSSKGISRLDLETMRFRRYYLDNLMSIGVYNNGLLAGTNSGLFSYNNKTDRFEKADHILDDEMPVSAIYQDNNQTLWLSSNQDYLLWKIENNKKEKIRIDAKGELIVYELLMDSKNRLWIATRYHGLLAYNQNTNSFKSINKSSHPFFLEDNSVRDILEDKEGRLWIGTFKGLAVFDLNKETCSFIHAGNNDEHRLSHNSVYSLFISNDDNIWIGTYFGGINYGKVSNQIFNKYHQSAVGERPSFPVIGGMIEDNNNNIWIATEGGGLDYFDRKENSFKNFPATNNKYGLSQTNIKSLLLTEDEKLIIGIFQGGLNILDIRKKEVKKYNDPSFPNYPNHVNSIIAYKNNYLLATESGLLLFNPKTESFTPFFDSIEDQRKTKFQIVCLYQDSNGIIWIGSEYNGLLSYNPEKKELKSYRFDEFNHNSIPYNSINYIIEDHKFRLWIGTDGGGFCMYNRKEDHFTTFNRAKNNLPSDFIYGITESRFGNLWIATSKGLSRFDVENKLFFNYTSESGFPLKELNYNALLLTKQGELFVGGIDGLVSFKERDLLTINENLNVNFSSLYVNNLEVMPNDESGILSNDISVAKSFTMKPNHTVFSIHFSSFNYNNTLNNKYQYQLEGFDPDWVKSEFNTTATYTNLNPGKYIFKVRATDVAYNALTNEKSIEIIVKPPLSRTWYAYSLYAILVIGLILLFNHFYLTKVSLQYQLKNERSENKRIEELNSHKLRFFTNISHEFMSPLTIILSSLENAFSKHKIPSKLQWQLNLALRNAKRLKNLNSELLDFRKIEQGYLKLKVQENDIVPYLQEIYEAFEEIARHKELKYSFIKEVEHLPVFYDSSQMDKVFYNLLSNAFNHVTNKTGEISIHLIEEENNIEIEVRDNGRGIPKDELEKVFNRFFQHDSNFTDNSYQGSGIGLALTQSIVIAHKGTIVCESEENYGTTFKVSLMKGSTHFSEDEISTRKRNNTFSIDKELIHLSKEILDDEDDHRTNDLADSDAPLLLIVDDNPEIRISISSLFNETHQIITANNGFDGIDKALEYQPDIIISDVLMPKLSGFDMCKTLKTNLNTSHIPILLLTALDSEEDRTIAFKNGADSYCTKPFNSEMLKARIENLFQNRTILQQKFSTDPNASNKTITKNLIDREFLDKTQKIIENNLLNPDFNVDLFASEMNLGRTIFYSKVKTITGQTPNDYIQTIRLKKAADMLVNDPTKNVSEIAYDTGFNSPRYFTMAFKKHFGVTPSNYIKI